MKLYRKIVLASGAAAMLVIAPVPLVAANMLDDTKAKTGGDMLKQTADGHRRRWRHRDRVDTGDVLTGIGILAGIAILADAASKADKRDRNEPRYEDRRSDRPVYQDDDLGTAVNACTDAAERSAGNGARVNEIRSVTREGDGWRVDGDLNSNSFSCAAINGRIEYLRIGDREI
jgi:hypothetical protein